MKILFHIIIRVNAAYHKAPLSKVWFKYKGVLQIIFKYHQMEKKILFVGLPKKLELKINMLTHVS